MARPVNIVKSNFLNLFKEFGLLPFGKEVKDFSKMWENELKDWGTIYTFIVKKYSNEVRDEMEMFAWHLNSQIWPSDEDDARISVINEAIRKKDFSILEEFLAEDENKESPANLLYLFRFFTEVIVNTSDRKTWEFGEDIGYDMDDKTIYPPHDMANKTIYPFPPEMIASNLLLPPDEYGFLLKVMRKVHLTEIEKGNYPTRSMKLEKKAYNEIEKLIEGYGLYLERLEKGEGSKRSICLDIEKEIGVNNVRQEFNRYDEFFKKLRNHVQRKHDEFILDPETVKVIMNFCFNRAKSL